MAQRYRLDRRLSHADVDVLGELKVPALLGLLEQAAIEASTAAGFDAAWYTREGRIWIIRRTRLERLVPVGGGDTVAVETEIADFRRARSLRRYHVQRDGVRVAAATTDWVYCDLATSRPVRVPESMRRALAGHAMATALPRAKPLPTDGGGCTADLEVIVQPSHLDHVAHVNNAVYVSYLEDGAFALFAAHGWPLGRMLDAGGALRIRRLDAEYRSDAMAGECLRVRSWMADGALASAAEPPAGTIPVTQVITRAGGSEVLRGVTEWVWRRRPPIVGGVPPA